MKTSKILSAWITLLSGIVLSFLSFFLRDAHEIDPSVLWYFGQCLLYAGGIFSLHEYALREINKQMEQLRREQQKMRQA